jgi:hypothetical protein
MELHRAAAEIAGLHQLRRQQPVRCAGRRVFRHDAVHRGDVAHRSRGRSVPDALATAKSLGVEFTPFAMAMMMAASCGFATPIGYQTNLMVYGPGGYRYTDYLRFGGPLNSS